jgi:hypothetical protein
VSAYKIRVRERIDSSPHFGQSQTWIEYQVVSGRKIAARFGTMKEAEKFVADSIGGENV